MKQQQEENSLQKQLSNLEMKWDSIKQSFSTSNRHNSTTVAAVNHRFFRLYDNSPKELMSLLQQENSPYDRAAIEVIEQRETDYDNGWIIGRRLFEESEVDSEEDNGEKSEISTKFSRCGSEKYDENYENCEKVCVDFDENRGVFDECFDMDGKSEVGTEFSCIGSKKYGENCVNSDEKSGVSCLDSERYGENFEKVCMDLFPAADVAVMTGDGGGGGGRRGGFVWKWMIWVVVMMFAIGIVAFKCRGHDEQILVPT